MNPAAEPLFHSPMEQILIADLSIPFHCDAVVRLLNEYARGEMGGGNELSSYAKSNLIAELRKRNGFHSAIALVDNEPAGLAICFEGFSTFACKPLLNIHDLVVLPMYRGRGIARRLLQEAETIALGLGCCKLTLEVLEGNLIARTLYQSQGYAGYQLSPQLGGAMFWQKKLEQS